MAEQRVYFPGLNALRFYAALSVVVVHIEQLKGFFGFTSGTPYRFPLVMEGLDAVTLFFVLSGFLITYLLLEERRRTDTVQVGRFYLRRILRIWPLYYAMLLIGFGLLPLFVRIVGYEGPYMPATPNPKTLLVFMLLLPNVAGPAMFPPGISQLWTVTMEEQFYLVWPLLLKVLGRWVLLCLLAIIGIKLALLLAGFLQSGDLTLFYLWAYLRGFRIESMAIGGLGAYLIVRQRETILRVIFHPAAELAIYGLMALQIVFFPIRSLGEGASYPVSLLYMLLILNVARNPRARLKLEQRPLRFLGRISYGIYMLHLVVTYVVLVAFSYAGFDNGIAANVVLYALVIGLTIGGAALSNYRFEMAFLRLKARFTVVPSGEGVAVATSDTHPRSRRAAARGGGTYVP